MSLGGRPSVWRSVSYRYWDSGQHLGMVEPVVGERVVMGDHVAEGSIRGRRGIAVSVFWLDLRSGVALGRLRMHCVGRIVPTMFTHDADDGFWVGIWDCRAQFGSRVTVPWTLRLLSTYAWFHHLYPQHAGSSWSDLCSGSLSWGAALAGVSLVQTMMCFVCGYSLCAVAVVFVVVWVRRLGGRTVSSNRGDHLEPSSRVHRSFDVLVGFCCLSEFIVVDCLALSLAIGVGVLDPNAGVGSREKGR